MASYAGNYNWIADQGATTSRQFTWFTTAGVAKNLTGWSAKMQVRENPGGTVVLELSTANGKIVLGGSAGTILCTAQPSDMGFTANLYQYDLELTDGTIKNRLVQGSFEVRAEITV